MGNVKGVLSEAAAIIPEAFDSERFPIPTCRMIVQLEPQEDIHDRTSLELAVAIAILIEFLNLPEEALGGKEGEQADSSVAEDLGVDLVEELRRERERIAHVNALQDRNYYLIGELNVHGQIRRVNGLLNMLYRAQPGDIVIVPAGNEQEARLWWETTSHKDVSLFTAATLREAYETVLGNPPSPGLADRRFAGFKEKRQVRRADIDFKDIVGQEGAKRAMEIAAAGGHHCLLYGPTGQGKSMLASAMVGILPPLEPTTDMEQIQQINQIYSARGLLEDGHIILDRPFRAIGAGITPVGLLGGNPRPGADPQPGEISLAHGGVLFMDEIDKFPGPLIEKLRAPLQEKQYIIQRATGSVTFPCDFVLVAAMNPCDCSYFGEWECERCHRVIPQEMSRCECGSESFKHRCTCSAGAERRFANLLSGPIQNRMHLKARAYSPAEVLPMTARAEATSTIRRRVTAARSAQAKRFAGSPGKLNSHVVTPREIAETFELSPEVRAELGRNPKVLPRTASMRTKVVTFAVARTIADLADSRQVLMEQFQEAVALTRDLNADYELRRRRH
jgi:magnesium chelatase family protein